MHVYFKATRLSTEVSTMRWTDRWQWLDTPATPWKCSASLSLTAEDRQSTASVSSISLPCVLCLATPRQRPETFIHHLARLHVGCALIINRSLAYLWTFLDSNECLNVSTFVKALKVTRMSWVVTAGHDNSCPVSYYKLKPYLLWHLSSICHQKKHQSVSRIHENRNTCEYNECHKRCDVFVICHEHSDAMYVIFTIVTMRA